MRDDVNEAPIDETPAHRLAFMHLSILDEIICFRSENIETDHLIEIGEKCRRLGEACNILIDGREA